MVGATRSWIPWAGVAALAHVALGGMVLSNDVVWAWLERQLPVTEAARRGVAREQAWLHAPGSAVSSVVVLGTSRAHNGVDAASLRKLLPGREVQKLTRPGLEPFQTRALVDQMEGRAPGAVVLVLSEFDTHRPLHLDHAARQGATTPRAIIDLLELAELGDLWADRTSLLRLSVGAALSPYRFRRVLRATGYGSRLSFAKRLGLEPVAEARSWGLSAEQERVVLAEFPRGFRHATLHWASLVAQIAPGPHVAVQQGLVRRTVQALRRRGAAVVLLEAPLHPAAGELYDRELRLEFLRFARELASEPGVALQALEAVGPLGRDDFGDLLHLVPSAAKKLTRPLLGTLRQAEAQIKGWDVGEG